MSDTERGPAPAAADGEGEAGGGGAGGRKARGRPRLTESDRARRRLESRKKYDVRRVYLGEAHGPWVDLRRRSGWSDAKLAAYLLGLERGQRAGRRGKPWEQIPKKPKRKKRRRRNVNCLKNMVIWYEDHKNRCPYEPHLAELDPTFGLYTTAVWQCEAGHRYFQDLHSPLKPLSDSENDSDDVGNGVGPSSSASSDDSSSSSSEDPTEPRQAPGQGPAATEGGTGASSGLITPDGIHIPFEAGEVGGGRRLGATEALEAVVCVPMPMQVGTAPGALFEGVARDALGEVVAGCPMQGVVPGSQVIIIAGPGYDGLQLNDGPCALIEGVAAYTQTEPEPAPPAPSPPAPSPSPDPSNIHTKKEKDELFGLKKEEPLPPTAIALPPELEPSPEGTEPEASDMSAIIYEIPKEPEKRRRSKRGRVTDADGLLEMFHCPYEGCSQVYVALSSFQNHVNLVHRKGKTKVCPHPGCGKKFYLSNHLRRHMIIHSGVREFTCETCGKSFKRKNHLEVHRRTHTGETPLQCEICGYQCRQRASLNWHMKKHRGELHYPFPCELCGKRFERLDSVKFHKLKSHPEPKPP
ncbi:zinc finger protein 653 isoform X2 [Alligator mississippiensis]|uniref:zinc finger protein 653 isoform X2 n=1 Tax=Alligator mississippiensis TaxID=8496 RepID=UPI0003D0790E|nr:zinc finger protein 653 isoform X2 [Alligator mississippiensis]